MLSKARKYILPTRLLSFVLAATVAAGTLFCCTTDAFASDADALNFSAPDSEYSVAPQGDIVSGLVGEGLLAAERDYLNAHSKYSVLYTATVPSEYYKAAVKDGKIYALAKPYKYTAVNGQSVSWLPVFAQAGDGEQMPLLWSAKDGAYCTFLEGGSGDEVRFTYAASVKFSEDMATDAVNEAYRAAVVMAAAVEEYNEVHGAWSERNDAYQTYLGELNAYNDARDAYEKYLDEKDAYRIASDAYEAWWDAYYAQKSLREEYDLQYSRFENNQAELAAYDAQLTAYNEYMALVDISPELVEAYEAKAIVAQTHLNVIDSFYRDITPMGHSFYGVISSSLVDAVIANEAELESLGGNREDIQKAIQASRELSAIFDGYDALSSDADRYAYMTQNLDGMRLYVTRLGTSLRNLAAVDAIMDRIIREGLKDEFYEFVAILYYCECALYNEKTFDSNEKYSDTAISSLLDVERLVADSDALLPLEDGWPTPPVTADDVTPVEHPGIRPDEVAEPDYVAPPPDVSTSPARPTAPEEVSDPGDTPPAEVEHPGDQPSAPVRDDTEEQLYLAYCNGEISYRESASRLSAQIYNAVSVKASTVRILVSAYDGNNAVAEFYVKLGESAEERLAANISSVKVINGKTYELVGWSTAPDGTAVDVGYISSLSGSLSLYALFCEVSDSTEEQTTVEDPLPDTESDTTTVITDDSTEQESEQKSEQGSTAESESKSETELESESLVDTLTDTEQNSGTVAESDESVNSDTLPNTETDESEKSSESVTDPDTETESGAGSNVISGSESESSPSTEADMELDVEIVGASLWARLLGRIGLVPLLIIGGALVGATVAGGVMAVVTVVDKKRRRGGKK
ncbi:MAG: hypothetical protein IJX74_04675 [Clostridia bacterium]|nr:hypothetical protein [Clostridia bacterium]